MADAAAVSEVAVDAEPVPVPDPVAVARSDAEAEALRRQARAVAISLTFAIVVAFSIGLGIILSKDPLVQIAGIGLIGFAGSGVGALSSLLMRYSTGMELGDGERVPSNVEGEMYSHRMAFPLMMRPVLGALIAPLLAGGATLFFTKHEEFKGSLDGLMIVSFIGGLYAKSAIEAAKNAFKVVFRA